MKTWILSFVIIHILFTIIIEIDISRIFDKLETIQPKYPITIDIPEEYKAISNNPNNKTVLQGYIANDTLFIEFKH